MHGSINSVNCILDTGLAFGQDRLILCVKRVGHFGRCQGCVASPRKPATIALLLGICPFRLATSRPLSYPSCPRAAEQAHIVFRQVFHYSQASVFASAARVCHLTAFLILATPMFLIRRASDTRYSYSTFLKVRFWDHFSVPILTHGGFIFVLPAEWTVSWECSHWRHCLGAHKSTL